MAPKSCPDIIGHKATQSDHLGHLVVDPQVCSRYVDAVSQILYVSEVVHHQLRARDAGPLAFVTQCFGLH